MSNRLERYCLCMAHNVITRQYGKTNKSNNDKMMIMACNVNANAKEIESVIG